MTPLLKRGVLAACLTVLALSLPTPAFAADAGSTSAGVSQAQAAGICDVMPIFWWCQK